MLQESVSDMESDNKWECSAERIRGMGYQPVDLIADHISGLPDAPVFRPFPAELVEKYLNSAVPEVGTDWENLRPHVILTPE